MHIKIKKIDPRALIPAYQTPGAAAFDFALIEPISIPARSIAKVRTGLVIEVPIDHVLLIFSRSSGPLKKGITMGNGVGVIDSDYRGPNDEIFLLLQNVTDAPVELKAVDRVAQGIIVPYIRGEFEETSEMVSPDRGGHGSTGT